MRFEIGARGLSESRIKFRRRREVKRGRTGKLLRAGGRQSSKRMGGIGQWGREDFTYVRNYL